MATSVSRWSAGKVWRQIDPAAFLASILQGVPTSNLVSSLCPSKTATAVGSESHIPSLHLPLQAGKTHRSDSHQPEPILQGKQKTTFECPDHFRPGELVSQDLTNMYKSTNLNEQILKKASSLPIDPQASLCALRNSCRPSRHPSSNRSSPALALNRSLPPSETSIPAQCGEAPTLTLHIRKSRALLSDLTWLS